MFKVVCAEKNEDDFAILEKYVGEVAGDLGLVRFATFMEVVEYALSDKADGGILTTEMIVKALWTGAESEEKKRSCCRVIMSCLKTILTKLGLEELLVAHGGQYYLNRKLYTCDADELLRGDEKAVLRYMDRYMEEYSWAKERKKVIDRFVSGETKN